MRADPERPRPKIRPICGAFSVIVLKTAEARRRGCCADRWPLARHVLLLPNGLGLNIDGTDNGGALAFVRCLPNGCVAEIVMDDALLKQLGDGKNAIFVVFRTPEEGIGDSRSRSRALPTGSKKQLP